MLLSGLNTGDQAVICSLDGMDREHIRKLISLGVPPGASIKVLQRSPTFVIAVDNAQFALDRTLASQIIVEKK